MNRYVKIEVFMGKCGKNLRDFLEMWKQKENSDKI